MPTINHPQRPESPLANLVNLGAGISQIATGFKQRNLIEQEAEKNKASAEAAQRETAKEAALQKEKDDPDSPLSQQIKQVGAYRLSKISQILEKSGEDPGPLNQLAEKLNAPKEIQIEGQMPQGVEGPGQSQVAVNPNYSPITGTQAEALLNSPQIKGLETLAEAKLKGEFTVSAAKERANSMLPLANARLAGVEIQRDKLATSAADHFDKDKLLTKYDTQANQIETDKHTLASANGRLTPGLINEIQQGIANVISGGGSAGLGKTEQIEIQNANQKIAKLKERFSQGVQYVDDPELSQYFTVTLNRLGNAINRNAANRAEQIRNGRAGAYKSSPAAIQVMNDKVNYYKQQVVNSDEKPSGGPKVGAVEDGHRFKGGNPADPKNWELVK